MSNVHSDSPTPSASSASSKMSAQYAGVAPFQLATLPYGYSDFEPIIDTATMHLHHDKHHRAYVDGVNAALAKFPEWHGQSIESILSRENEIPAQIRRTVHNMGGGHANHEFFWHVLAPRGSGALSGDLRSAI